MKDRELANLKDRNKYLIRQFQLRKETKRKQAEIILVIAASKNYNIR